MGNFDNNRYDRGRNDDRRHDRPSQMHSVICSKCGKSAQVPFRPTGNRPIFCGDCYKMEGGNQGRSNDRGSQMRQDRPMYDAICAKCGNRCQIPFQPRNGKDVYCSHCFEQNERGMDMPQDRHQSSHDLEEINYKLDRILEILSVNTVDANQEIEINEPEVIVNEIEVSEDKVVKAKKAPATRKAIVKKSASKKE